MQVHLLSGDPAVAEFPAACAAAKLDGCSRIAAAGPHNAGCAQRPRRCWSGLLGLLWVKGCERVC